MRGLIVAWAMVGIVAGAEPDEKTIADRVLKMRESCREVAALLTPDLLKLSEEAKALQAARISPAIKGDSVTINGRLVIKSQAIRKKMMEAKRDEMASLVKSVEKLRAGVVLFPTLRGKLDKGSYGTLPPDGIKILTLRSEKECVGRLLADDVEPVYVTLRGVDCKDWVEDQSRKVDGAFEASVEKGEIILTPIDPAPYKAAMEKLHEATPPSAD